MCKLTFNGMQTCVLKRNFFLQKENYFKKKMRKVLSVFAELEQDVIFSKK
jgi:hypothetical protein